MTPIPLGILAASGFVEIGAYDLLETQILSSSAALVTFTGLDTLATEYQHLQLRVTARSPRASSFGVVRASFNSESILNSDYGYRQFNANGTSFSHFGATGSMTINRVPAATEPAGSFGIFIVDILDATNSSKATTIRTLGGFSGTAPQINFYTGSRNTSPLSSMQLTVFGSTFDTGSRFSLYGIKGA